MGYGLTSLVPLEILRRHRRRWKQLSDQLNRDFWAKATDEFKMEYFSKCATNEEGYLSNFFGTTAEEKAAEDNDDVNAGQYMPVNLEKEDDSSDDEDENIIKNKCDKFAAKFDDTGNTEVTSGGRQQGNPLGSLVRRIRTGLANRNKSKEDLSNIDKEVYTEEALLSSPSPIPPEKVVKPSYDDDEPSSHVPLI